MKVEATIHFGKRGKKKQAQKAKPQFVGRTPRIAKLMALAIRFEGMVRRGKVEDYAELARLAQVTRARMTQIMNLNLLSPTIQEWLLHIPAVGSGRDLITLKLLQAACLEYDWSKQLARASNGWRYQVSYPVFEQSPSTDNV